MQWSDQTDKIVPALFKVQMEIKEAEASGRNPAYKSSYPTLEDIWDACKDALHKNNIFLLQATTSELETFGVETMLIHTSGQFVRSVLTLRPSKTDPQGAGSAITYARRYSLAPMLGIMQKDDDANLASGKQPPGLITDPLVAVQQCNSNFSDYVIPFPKFKGLKFEEVVTAELISYKKWILEKASKPISTLQEEYIVKLDAYLLELLHGRLPTTPAEPDSVTYHPAPNDQDIPIPF
jgi:hypothetical protein